MNTGISVGRAVEASAAQVDLPGRRTFLAQVIGACLAFVAAVLGIPAVGALVAAPARNRGANLVSGRGHRHLRGRRPQTVNITVLADLNGWIQTTQVKGVWVVRGDGEQFTVFNGRCTHLGCAYSWQIDQNEFTCPCHAGVMPWTATSWPDLRRARSTLCQSASMTANSDAVPGLPSGNL